MVTIFTISTAYVFFGNGTDLIQQLSVLNLVMKFVESANDSRQFCLVLY